MPTSVKIFVVDDDYFSRDGICGLIRDAGWQAEGFSSCEAFLAADRRAPNRCLVLDIHLPGMGGLELMGRLQDRADGVPIIAVSGSSRISEAVKAMSLGVGDFIEKPVPGDRLIASLTRALDQSRRADTARAQQSAAQGRLDGLTARQAEVLGRVLNGEPSKNIAADLGISQRTVENHRAAILRRTGARSLPALARLAMRADGAAQG